MGKKRLGRRCGIQGGSGAKKEEGREEKEKVTAEAITGAEAVAAACSLRHNLPTCSHSSSDKYRLTSQLKTLKTL